MRAKGDEELLAQMLLHEDPKVFVFNKPAGLAVQGGSGVTRSVDDMLEAWRSPKGEKPRLVHRLDRDTSGVLVVARTRLAAARLSDAFRGRDAKKTYWALVRGVPKKREGEISTWLVKEATPDGDRVRVAKHGEPGADHAVSRYRVIEQAARTLSWLEMEPHTGRTHQLRVHAAFIDCPIIGDPKYFEADQNWDFPGGIQNRLHLHARRIVIPHPDGGRVDVTAPLPPHMRQSSEPAWPRRKARGGRRMTAASVAVDRRDNSDLAAVIIMLLLTASWGLNGVAAKLSYPGFSPLFVSIARSTIGGILVLLWARYRGVRLFEADGTLLPGLLAGLLFTAEFVLIYSGLEFTSVARGALMLNTMPFWVLIGAYFVLGERISTMKVVGLILAFSGVALVFSDKLSSPGPDAIIGDLMNVAGGMLWAATTLVIKRSRLSSASAEKVLLYQLGFSAIMTIPLLAFAGPAIRDITP